MRKILLLALALVLALSLVACGGNTGNDNSGNGGNNNGTSQNGGNKNNNDKKSPEAAFQQFGLDLNQIKPNLAKADETTLEYGNEVSDTVYYRKAHYMEKSEADIDEAAGKAYNQKMFDLCKTASADGKIYTNKTNSDGDPKELTSIDDLIDPTVLINLITWSYKIDGMWVDVYMDWNLSGDKIGIQLGGSGSY